MPSTIKLGYRIQYDYDAQGNVINTAACGPKDNEQNSNGQNSSGQNSQTDTNEGRGQLQGQVAYTVNALDFVTAVNAHGSVHQTTVDAYGHPLSSTDPNNNPAATYQYDALYRLTRIQDALGHTVQYDYNVHNQLTRVRTANNAVTTYQYNDFNELTQEHSPDRGTIHYQHDSAGNIRHITDARGIQTATPDALNRLTHIAIPIAVKISPISTILIGTGSVASVILRPQWHHHTDLRQLR